MWLVVVDKTLQQRLILQGIVVIDGYEYLNLGLPNKLLRPFENRIRDNERGLRKRRSVQLLLTCKVNKPHLASPAAVSLSSIA